MEQQLARLKQSGNGQVARAVAQNWIIRDGQVVIPRAVILTARDVKKMLEDLKKRA